MNDEEVVRAWLSDPQNPELIKQVERTAPDPVVIDDEYIARLVRERVGGNGAESGTQLAHACPLSRHGADETVPTGECVYE